MRKFLFLNLSLLLLTACQTTTLNSNVDDADTSEKSIAFSSTYQTPESDDVVFTNATVFDGLGGERENTDLWLSDGKIKVVGVDLDIPDEIQVIDAAGKWITPGIIDVHSHMGVYPSIAVASLSDGNEMVSPSTAGVWAEHSVWPQDPTFEKAIAGGVTTAQILPGSANLFGGRGVTLKIVPAVTMMEMKFPDAPHALKMACGENPKRVYGQKGGPQTRMGNMAGYRSKWIEAQGYKRQWDDYEAGGGKGDAPTRDLELETLMGVLNGEIKVHNHCYRADEMANMIELAGEFGYSISAFHHAVEAYKVAPILAENDVCAVVWADWWGFKQEAYDIVRENAALLELAGACTIIHSDDEIQIQRLNQEVAKAVAAAKSMNRELPRGVAIKWITYNAAKAIGLDDRIGSIESGKNADVVLWSSDPLSVYAKAEKVWIDGALRYDINDPSVWPTSDFNIGILKPTGDRP